MSTKKYVIYKDGADADRYQEKDVKNALNDLEKFEQGE